MNSPLSANNYGHQICTQTCYEQIFCRFPCSHFVASNRYTITFYVAAGSLGGRGANFLLRVSIKVRPVGWKVHTKNH